MVPVGINYDRGIEDRTLLRERETRSQVPTLDRVARAASVGRFLLSRRWRRYGRATVTIGTPVSVDAWLTTFEVTGMSVFDAPRAERLPWVQHFCDDVLTRIGAIIPVTPVPLACAALQSFDARFVSREAPL